MCFSATGSFALSGVLAGMGAFSIARNTSKPRAMFAAVPLIFAAQQAIEGVVWLTMDRGADAVAQRLAASAFLAVALVVWPTWLPFALRMIEVSPRRRRLLTSLFAVGVGVSAFASLLLTIGRPMARVVGHSVRYEYRGSGDLPIHTWYLLAYILPTVVPFFVSTARLTSTIGATLIVSLVIAVAVEREALASVWCFFAAMLSGVVLLAIERERRSKAVLASA